jgi:hypothetical protein
MLLMPTTITLKILRTDYIAIDDDDRSKNCPGALSHWITLPISSIFFSFRTREHVPRLHTHHRRSPSSSIHGFPPIRLYKRQASLSKTQQQQRWLPYKVWISIPSAFQIIIHAVRALAGKTNSESSECEAKELRTRKGALSLSSWFIVIDSMGWNIPLESRSILVSPMSDMRRDVRSSHVTP